MMLGGGCDGCGAITRSRLVRLCVAIGTLMFGDCSAPAPTVTHPPTSSTTCSFALTTAPTSFSAYSDGSDGDLYYKLWAGNTQVLSSALETINDSTTTGGYGSTWSGASWGSLSSASIDSAGATSTVDVVIESSHNAALTHLSLLYLSNNGWAVSDIKLTCGEYDYSVDITSNSITSVYTDGSISASDGLWLDYYSSSNWGGDWYVKLTLDRQHFEVESGQCTASGNCFYSPGFPSSYANDDACVINALFGGTLSVKSFELESYSGCIYDDLTVDGTKFCGTTGPDGTPITSSSSITFKAASSEVSRGGFEVCCFTPLVPMPAPTPVPTLLPSAAPSPAPTATPTGFPNPVPTPGRTSLPSLAPTTTPTASPTSSPTPIPSPAPSITCENGTSVYRLKLYDSGGDGWQGATYNVSNSTLYTAAGEGCSVAFGTLADGSESLEWLCLADGCFELVVTGGSAPSEIGFECVF